MHDPNPNQPVAPGINVFAYGSNLHPNRMRRRAPSARLVGIGFVAGRKLEFRKRGKDGSAKADAMHTGIKSDRIWGAIYNVCGQDKRALDGYESLGVGYDERVVGVCCSPDRRLEAIIYEARREAVDPSLRPFCWYLNYVRKGAEQHSLPFCYINRELAIESIADPDPYRRKSNEQILAEIAGGFERRSESR